MFVFARFKGSADKYNRIRLLTSDLQFICNEFFLRTKVRKKKKGVVTNISYVFLITTNAAQLPR